jgi:nitrilase
MLSIGVHERIALGPGRGSLFNTQLLFDSDGELVARHRKIMPTFTERMIWAQGDGSDLHAAATAIGRVGSLICWEHWMPLARQALHDSGEDIHVAAWPSVKEMHQLASRHYAFEGRCFVVAAGSVLRATELPPELELIPEVDPQDLVMRGGSLIASPSGRVLAGPVWDQEMILTADCDLDEIAEESLALDVSGHYARRDIFDFRVRTAQPNP